MSYRISILAAALLACIFNAAHAQNTPPSRIRGTITAIDEKTMTIATREGPIMKVKLADNLTVNAVLRDKLSSIKPGTFIGTAAEAGPDGKLMALEILIFPDSMRGTGEGHYDWDLKPGSTMTNATVDAAVTGKSGRELELSFKGGTAKVTVPPKAPIVTIVPAKPSDLKSGQKVFLVATKDAAGEFTALRVNYGKNVAPPM